MDLHKNGGILNNHSRVPKRSSKSSLFTNPFILLFSFILFFLVGFNIGYSNLFHNTSAEHCESPVNQPEEAVQEIQNSEEFDCSDFNTKYESFVNSVSPHLEGRDADITLENIKYSGKNKPRHNWGLVSKIKTADFYSQFPTFLPPLNDVDSEGILLTHSRSLQGARKVSELSSICQKMDVVLIPDSNEV